MLNIFHFFSKFSKIHFVQNWSKCPPGTIGKNGQKVIDTGQMHQNRWSVLGDPRQVPDPIFGKMGKIIFCIF